MPVRLHPSQLKLFYGSSLLCRELTLLCGWDFVVVFAVGSCTLSTSHRSGFLLWGPSFGPRAALHPTTGSFEPAMSTTNGCLSSLWCGFLFLFIQISASLSSFGHPIYRSLLAVTSVYVFPWSFNFVCFSSYILEIVFIGIQDPIACFPLKPGI